MPSSNVSWGIEIGGGALKAMKLVKDGENVTVADFVLMPHKRVLTTPEIDRTDAIRVALGGFLGQYRDELRGASVAVSVPGNAAFARFAKLPPVEPKGVEGLVKFEAVQQIPFPIEEVEWDYQTFASEDSPDVEVGIFAMTKEKVSETLAIYRDVDLTPGIITLSPVAVYNAIAYDLNFTDKTPGTVIIDIGSQSTDIIIAEGGRVWVRTFPMGGHAFTEAIGAAFKLPYVKAEKLKREIETSKYKKNITQALKPVFADFFQDVQRSISYYQDTHPDAELKRIIGIGSTFKLLGMRRLLAQQTKLDVHRLDHFKRLSVEGAGAADFEASTINMTTAYGLALQGLGNETIRANLMPTPVIREAVWKAKTPWFVAAAAIGVLAGGVTFIRPFLDDTVVTESLNDNSINTTIQTAVRTGNTLKSDWQTISQDAQPGFVAENIRRLVDTNHYYPLLARDVAQILQSSADAQNPADPFRLVRYETAYLNPGIPIDSAQAQDPSRSNSRRSSGGDTVLVGPNGAVRVKMYLDTTSADPPVPFINETVIAWLNQNATRPGLPYTIEAIPEAEAVRLLDPNAPLPQPGQATTNRRRGTGMQDPEAGRRAPINDGNLPPLPDDIRPADLPPGTQRFEIMFTYQLLEEPLPDEAPASGDDGSTPDQTETAR